MKPETQKECLKDHFREELILTMDFWCGPGYDSLYGGFLCSCRNDNPYDIDKEAPKGIVAQGRTLWALSAACQIYECAAWKSTAQNVYQFLIGHFIDQEYGWVYQSLDREGNPVNTAKSVYGGAFLLYALSEYYATFHDAECLELCKRLYRDVEDHARDRIYGGYFDQFDRKWNLSGTGSGTASGAMKSLKTQQHLIEAFSKLYTIWPEEQLRQSVRDLLSIVDQHYIRKPEYSFCQTMSQQWEELDTEDLFGDLAENIWLFDECAQMIGDSALQKVMESNAKHQFERLKAIAMDPLNGGMFEMEKNGSIGTRKVWWVQCEAINCFLEMYQKTGDIACLKEAEELYRFCTKVFIDEKGMWKWQTTDDGKDSWRLTDRMPIADAYHIGRMCMRALAVL